jgi:hypothetical protein
MGGRHGYDLVPGIRQYLQTYRYAAGMDTDLGVRFARAYSPYCSTVRVQGQEAQVMDLHSVEE